MIAAAGAYLIDFFVNYCGLLFQPTDAAVWRKCGSPLFPRRTVDGGHTSSEGVTWRRWNGTKWEYKQDPESRSGVD